VQSEKYRLFKVQPDVNKMDDTKTPKIYFKRRM